MLESLTLRNLGPAPEMTFALGERVNVLTGDNGLGKTFLLDLAWWALSRTWADKRIIRPASGSSNATVDFVVRGKGGATHPVNLKYSDDAQDWSPFPPGPPPATGLVIYARIDGGFSVKDPERNRWRAKDEEGRVLPRPEAFHFSKRQVWEGLRDDDDKIVCRGLIEDWETWRLKSNGAFKMLTEVLAELSPGGKEQQLRPGDIPARLADYGAVDIPTIVMPYGEIPIYHASAAVRRILSLAYLIVWAWTEHRIEAKARGHESTKRIVLLWDEIDAHLHPQWQRTILPSVVGVLERLLREADGTQLQVIATTHAPVILASMETHWDEATDRLFNLQLTEDGKSVEAEEVQWARFGDASGWLASPAFDMDSGGYSPEAERAMNAADNLIAGFTDELPEGLKDAESIHQELVRSLDGGDSFWPLWLPFYRKAGAQL